MRRFLLFTVLAGLFLASAQASAVPSVDEILANYVRALGGEAALRKVTTRAAAGTVEIVTYGDWGRYQEFAAAPNRLVRTFSFDNYGVIQRCFDGKNGWEESPEYGAAPLSGARLDELRRQADFYPALGLRNSYPKVSVAGRSRFEDRDAFEVRAVASTGALDTLWFDAATGLLLGVESLETFPDGASQRIRMLYEDYRSVDGVSVPHRIRCESPRLLWIVTRGVVHNVAVDDEVFESGREDGTRR